MNPIAFSKVAALCLVSLFSGLGSLLFADEGLPSVMDLQAAYVEQNGGLSNIRALRSLVAYGEISGEDGINLDFKLYRKRPNFYRIEIQRPQVKVITAYDGKNTQRQLEKASGEQQVVELSETEAEAIQISSDFDGPFFQLYGQIESFEVLGVAEVNGAPAYELSVSPDSGSTYDRIWLDAENYQEVKVRARSSEDGGSVDRETIEFSDFFKVRGLWVAGEIRRQVGDQRVMTITVDRVRANVGVFNSFFERL